ncbi:hypothetical protein OIV83_006204 [Microbotryomycetes sp. JL201]|nr:hypothetical protein OIV83_006204 [Microbotryomycetes sp. JL201]
MIMGVGVDLLSLVRLRSLIARRGADRLARRILSSTEEDELRDLRQLAAWTSAREELYLGTRWAAKEAGYKAIFPVHRPTWKHFHLSKHDGKPALSLDMEGDSRSGELRLHLSLSHDNDLVIAYVVAEQTVV